MPLSPLEMTRCKPRLQDYNAVWELQGLDVMRSPKKLAIAALRRLRPLIPPHQRLPFVVMLARIDGGLEPELLHLDSLVPKGSVAVDVGANCGLYSYALAQIASKVYAFEINSWLTAELELYGSTKIEVFNCGLSSTVETVRLYTPVTDSGFEMAGWGTLDPRNLPPCAKTRSQDVCVKPLDTFRLPEIHFMKINVVGHEVHVLNGARETIVRLRPTVLIEVKDENVQAVDSYFATAEYRKCTLQELIGIRGSKEKYIYLPRERRLTNQMLGNRPRG
jgi:FkbM family methyltransferase